MLLWASLKNYLHSLRYVFTILGMILIFLVGALSYTVRETTPVVQKATNDIQTITSSIDFSPKELTDAADDAMTELTSGDFYSAIGKITDPEWALGLLTGALDKLYERFVGYANQIEDVIQQALDRFIEILTMALIIFAIGPVLGYILVMYFIRSDVEKRNIFHTILAALLDCVILAASGALLYWISTKVKIDPVIFIAIFPALSGYLLLIAAYLMNGCKKKEIKFTQVTKFYNILLLYLACIIELVLTAAICALLYYLTESIAVTGVIAIGLVMVCAVALSLNATAYVNMLIQKKETKENKEAKEELARINAGKEAGTETAGQNEPVPEVKSEPQPVPEVKAEPQPAAEVKADPQPAAEVKADPQPAAGVKADPQPVPEVKAEPQPAAEVKAEPQPAAEVKAEPQPAAEVKNEPEAAAGSESTTAAETAAEDKTEEKK